MKAKSKRHAVPPALRGYQVVYLDDDAVCVYGDPDGLRSLAEVLAFAANLDQTALGNGQPTDDSFHCHVLPGEHLELSSLRMVVGRVDTASGRFRDEVFPTPKRMRKARKQ